MGLGAFAGSPKTFSVGSAKRSLFRSSSTAATRSVEITVFTLAISRPRPLRTVSCETFLTFDESCHRTWRESQPPEVRHFLRPPLLWPAFRRECHPAFVLWTTVNRVPGASIELARREPAATYAPQ